MGNSYHSVTCGQTDMTKLMAAFLLDTSLIMTSKSECHTGARILNLSTPHPIHMRMFTHAHACANPHTCMQGETDQLNSWTNATMSNK
jgi:hypothetical protein